MKAFTHPSSRAGTNGACRAHCFKRAAKRLNSQGQGALIWINRTVERFHLRLVQGFPLALPIVVPEVADQEPERSSSR